MPSFYTCENGIFADIALRCNRFLLGGYGRIFFVSLIVEVNNENQHEQNSMIQAEAQRKVPKDFTFKPLPTGGAAWIPTGGIKLPSDFKIDLKS